MTNKFDDRFAERHPRSGHPSKKVITTCCVINRRLSSASPSSTKWSSLEECHPRSGHHNVLCHLSEKVSASALLVPVNFPFSKTNFPLHQVETIVLENVCPSNGDQPHLYKRFSLVTVYGEDRSTMTKSAK